MNITVTPRLCAVTNTWRRAERVRTRPAARQANMLPVARARRALHVSTHDLRHVP